MWTGTPLSTDRSGRRPLLTTLEGRNVEVVVTTHYHDDHVAGINLLRDVTGARAWIPENVAPILAEPHRYDLPCLWYDPVRADRVLPIGTPFTWHEYELTLHELPGHTRYAVAIAVDVDGRRILFTGDQQSSGRRPALNYQYRNRFSTRDYIRSAELYASLRPDVLLGGHWLPQEVDDEVLRNLMQDGRRLAELHSELLPPSPLGVEGFAARIEPYRATAAAGETIELDVHVTEGPAEVRLVVPEGWSVEPALVELGSAGPARFRVTPRGAPAVRTRVAADVDVDGVPYGQQAEALVDVT
jgi:glyoxylase-like metal-dependent hydrolase (beta-lactamase superfamily II)